MKNGTIRGAAGLLGFFAFLLIIPAGCSHLGAGEANPVKQISKEQLKDQLGASDSTIIDVRSRRDWENSGFKIPGAVRQSSASADTSWAAVYPKDRPIYLYCA